MSFHFETHCYLYTNTLDFDPLIQTNTRRFAKDYIDESHILISLTKQRDDILTNEQGVRALYNDV